MLQHPKQTFHYLHNSKNRKQQPHRLTPLSHSSDELTLSIDSGDDKDSFVSSIPDELNRRRSYTFTVKPISKPLEFHEEKKPHLKAKQDFCQNCIRQENLLHHEHQRLIRVYDENKKLTNQLRSLSSLNRKYKEENIQLTHHISKITNHLQDYQRNFNLLKEKLQSKQDNDAQHLNRLRHELKVYNQVIEAKRSQEQNHIGYFAYRDWIKKS